MYVNDFHNLDSNWQPAAISHFNLSYPLSIRICHHRQNGTKLKTIQSTWRTIANLMKGSQKNPSWAATRIRIRNNLYVAHIRTFKQTSINSNLSLCSWNRDENNINERKYLYRANSLTSRNWMTPIQPVGDTARNGKSWNGPTFVQ